MRTVAPSMLPIFRSDLQLRLLSLLTETDREWTTAELSASLEASPASLHRELHRLLAAGLVERRAVGRTQLYRGASESPLYEPLRDLIARTLGVEGELRRTLDDFPGIELALIHGSWAGGGLRPTSDVDVLIVGDVPYRELRTALHRLGQTLGRRIDVVVFGVDEFGRRLEEGNSFVLGALAGPNIPLVGTPSRVHA